MNSTVTATSPKFFPEDFNSHVLDRIGRNAAEVDGGDAKVGGQPAAGCAQCGVVVEEAVLIGWARVAQQSLGTPHGGPAWIEAFSAQCTWRVTAQVDPDVVQSRLRCGAETASS